MSELSETITHQRQTHTCSYHAISKVIVQNVFQQLIARKVNSAVYTRNQCNRYLDNEVFKHGVEPSPEECSAGGYERILQFLYVYNIISENNKCKLKKKSHEEEPVGFEEIEKTLSQIQENKMPHYFDKLPQAAQKMVEMLGQVNVTIDLMGIRYIHKKYVLHQSRMSKEQFTTIFENVKKSIRKGLYVFITLYANELDEQDEHAVHAVHAVATFRNKLVIKNSWGDGTYEMDIDGEITLGRDVYSVCEVGFLIPISSSNTYSSSIECDVEGTEDDNETGEFLSGLSFTHEMNELGVTLDEVDTMSNGKELSRSIRLKRGDAVATKQGVGIFTEYTDGGVVLFPGIVVYGIAHRTDVRTVPDALELLTSLNDEDARALERATGTKNIADAFEWLDSMEDSGLEKKPEKLAKNLENSSMALHHATKFKSTPMLLAQPALFKRGEAVNSSIGPGIFLDHHGALIRMRHEGVTKTLDLNGIHRIDINSVPNGVEMLKTLVKKDRNKFSRFTAENEPIYHYKRNFEESSAMLQLSSPSSSSGTKKSPPSPKNTTRRR
jgi:hypothetical protein